MLCYDVDYDLVDLINMTPTLTTSAPNIARVQNTPVFIIKTQESLVLLGTEEVFILGLNTEHAIPATLPQHCRLEIANILPTLSSADCRDNGGQHPVKICSIWFLLQAKIIVFA